MQHTPFWWEDAGVPTPLPDQPALPNEADVVIVGAGLTGLSAARTLARAGRSVLVLDRGAPGIGASSRNGGQVGGGHRLHPSVLDAQYGRDLATRLLHEAHIDSVDFFNALIASEGIDCDWEACGRFRGNWTAAEYDAGARDLDALRKRIPLTAYAVPRDQQHTEISTELYAGGTVFPTHGAINPAKYTRGLLDAACRAGARVIGDTEVHRIETGSLDRVHTAKGTVSCGSVLIATNGYTGPATPALRRRIVPVPSFIVATDVLGENRVRALMPARRVYVESRVRHCYFRPSPDGQRLVFGGRAALFPVSEAIAQSQLSRLIADVFPELADTPLTHSWRGFTGFSFAQLPHVGQVDGLHLAMGYSGNGNTMAPYLGHKAALQILGDPEGDTAFSHTRFEGRLWHRGAPWFMPAADAWFRVRDVWDRVRHSR
ncbi:MAG: FAD-binding oxidoreductase [Pseudomonadota bacterium]